MPKVLRQKDYDALAAAVPSLLTGAGLDDVLEALRINGREAVRRTVQRHLAVLVAQGRLELRGRGPASRYFHRETSVAHYFAPESDASPAALEEPASASSPKSPRQAERSAGFALGLPDLAVSPEAAAVRAAVRAPRHLRRPVGYNREWLEAYRPNESFYLPAALRARLAAAGRAADAGAAPAGTHARDILDRLLIDLSWNSSRLEGNTYSLLETERLLALGQGAEGKDVREARMILNHKAAIELLVEQADEIGFNRYTLLNLHALLAEGLLPDDRSCGRLRAHSVGIGGSVFHPLANPSALEECFELVVRKAAAIRDPFEQSFFAMVHLPYLQPFEDVNKRVSRLAANIPFIRHNFSPITFVEVPEQDYVAGLLGVYELNRVELLRDVFAWAYERSCARYAAVQKSLAEPDPFRLRHRERIVAMVGAVMRGAMDRAAAVAHIRREVAAAGLSAADAARLTELTETAILDLHEGNFARYRVRPSEYHRWRALWG